MPAHFSSQFAGGGVSFDFVSGPLRVTLVNDRAASDAAARIGISRNRYRFFISHPSRIGESLLKKVRQDTGRAQSRKCNRACLQIVLWCFGAKRALGKQFYLHLAATCSLDTSPAS